MECSIYGVNEKSKSPADKGAGSGICADAGGITRVVGTSDLLPLAFLGPLNVTVGSSRFQQFFLIYAKLMAGLGI